MKQLMLIDSQAIQSGIWKTAKAAGMLWSEGNNVVFRDQGFRSIQGGLQQSTALADQARDVAQAYVSGTKRVYFGTDTDLELYSLTSGVWTKTTIGAWPTAGQYADLETWGTWLLGTNNIDPVKVWKNGGGLVNLAGTPFTRARIIKRKQPFIFAFNTNNIGDTAAEWTSDSNPEDWTPSLSNKAGNYNIRDLDSEILAVEDIGNRLAVYSRSAVVLGSYVGGDNVWGWTRGASGIGAVSRRSVVTLDPLNYGLTKDGIFRTDGVSFQYVDDPAMLKFIRDTANFEQEHLFWGMADAVLKAVTFNFLDVDSKWHQVSYYPDTGVFTKGNLQLTAGARKEVFNFPIVASEDLKMGYWQGSPIHFGGNVSWNLQTKPLDFGSRETYKIHQLTRVEGQIGAGVNLRIRSHDDSEDEGVIIYDKPLVRDNYIEYDSRYFSYEFYGDQPAYVVGMEIFGIAGGVGR